MTKKSPKDVEEDPAWKCVAIEQSVTAQHATQTEQPKHKNLLSNPNPRRSLLI